MDANDATQSPAHGAADGRGERIAVAITFALAALALFLRSPDRLLQPELWAEDGVVYLKDAYELPAWLSLFKPHQGYQALASRVIAELGLLGGVHRNLPLVWNLASTLVGALAIAPVGSRLYAPLLPSRAARVLAALAIAAGGPQHEILATVTNVQWSLVLCGVHLLVALQFGGAPRAGAGRQLWFGTAACLLVLASPQLVIFVPLLAWVAYERWRDHRWRDWWLLGIAAGCALQAWSYASTRARGGLPPGVGAGLGRHLERTLDVLYVRELVQPLVPPALAQPLLAGAAVWPLAGLALVLAAGLAFACRHQPRFLAAFALLCVGNVALLYLGHSEYFDPQQLELLVGLRPIAGRYFFLTHALYSLATFVALGELWRSRRWSGLGLTACALQLAAGLSWFRNEISHVPTDWPSASARVRALGPGDSTTVAVNPPGWQVTLTRPAP